MSEASQPRQAAGAAPRTGAGTRLYFIDMLRAFASQLIVWHHLVFYGPLSDTAYPLAPVLMDWLYDYARMAVQAFFVVGGFLTARTLARDSLSLRQVGVSIVRRYQRIGLPYLATLALAVVANAVARQWMVHDSISAPPSIRQLVAHVFFVHDILDFEPLTAGIWYLAVDFQLVLLALFVGLAATWLAAVGPGWASAATITQALLGLLACGSLFVFNRQAELDAWAIYFVGSYYVGMVVAWTVDRRMPRPLLWAYLGLVGVAVVADFRSRLLVAAGVGLAIWAAHRTGVLQRWPQNSVVAYLGRISYSLFLVHFPVCLVVNAWYATSGPHSEIASAVGMLLAYLLSTAVAILFYHRVEAPVVALGRRGKQRPQARVATT